MKPDEPLRYNISRTVGLSALKQVRSLIDAELADESYRARALRVIGRYGWLVLPLLAVLIAYLLGVR